MRQIRRELRVHGFSAVRVENVNNVQGWFILCNLFIFFARFRLSCSFVS